MAMELVKAQEFPVQCLDQRMAKNQADNKRRVSEFNQLKNEVFTDYWRQGRTFGHDFEQLLHIRKK
jgi:hypothetical protein